MAKKKPAPKKDDVLEEKDEWEIGEAVTPHKATVSEVLDQVEENFGSEEVKSSSSGLSVEAKKNYEQHPKFQKFKGAKT